MSTSPSPVRSLLRTCGTSSMAGLAVAAALLVSPAVSFAQSEKPEVSPEAKSPPVKENDDKKDAGKPTDGTPEVEKQKVYFLPLIGKLGSEVTPTPVRDAVADARKSQPDYVVVVIDDVFTPRPGREDDDEELAQAGAAWDTGLEASAEIATILIDEIRSDPKWVKKPKLICWVKNAYGPSAFLPWSFRDIYYSSRSRHGGIGFLDHLFDGRGDVTVREKQYSLRMGRAAGLAEKGGHNPILIRAMGRMDCVLSVTFVGGEPEYHEDYSGELLLTDDGVGARRDTIQDMVRGTGNDNLDLNADLAKKLKVSKGTADTKDDLLFDLGLSRTAEEVKSNAERIFTNWKKSVEDGVAQIRKAIRDARETAVNGATKDVRVSQRGKRIGLLKRARDLLLKYKEAFPGYTRTLVQLNTEIEQLTQANMYDR